MSPHKSRIRDDAIVSPTVLEQVVDNYFSQYPEDDLRLKVLWRVLAISKVPSLLDERKLRWSYDLDREALHIKMPSPLHDALFHSMITLLDDCEDARIFTREERRMLHLTPIPRLLSGTLSSQSASKKEAWLKHPDGMVERLDPSSRLYIPAIAIEIGFSQKYDDLLLDMDQWLLKTDSVNAVILIDIKETKKPTPQGSKGESRERLRVLLEKYGNAQAKEMYDMDGVDENFDEMDHGDIEETSSPDLYAELDKDVESHPEDWVGDLRVSVEVWGRGREFRGRVSILPDVLPPPSSPPFLKPSDFFPSSRATEDINFDTASIRERIEIGRNELALNRALRFLRPREP